MNENFVLIDPKDFNDNIIRLIGFDWMLITAGKIDNYNTMTAAWGGLGFLWNLPVAFIFIRPQRYTFQFTEKYDRFSLCFFDKKYKKALAYCGKYSGRDVNKALETGLTPIDSNSDIVAFSEASLIIECTKLYADDLNENSFIQKEISKKNYPEKDYHRMYIAKLDKIWRKKH